MGSLWDRIGSPPSRAHGSHHKETTCCPVGLLPGRAQLCWRSWHDGACCLARAGAPTSPWRCGRSFWSTSPTASRPKTVSTPTEPRGLLLRALPALRPPNLAKMPGRCRAQQLVIQLRPVAVLVLREGTRIDRCLKLPLETSADAARSTACCRPVWWYSGAPHSDDRRGLMHPAESPSEPALVRLVSLERRLLRVGKCESGNAKRSADAPGRMQDAGRSHCASLGQLGGRERRRWWARDAEMSKTRVPEDAGIRTECGDCTGRNRELQFRFFKHSSAIASAASF